MYLGMNKAARLPKNAKIGHLTSEQVKQVVKQPVNWSSD